MGPIVSPIKVQTHRLRDPLPTVCVHALSTMASSNSPKSEKKNKTSNGEITKSETKTKKKKNIPDTDKDENNNNNNNKRKDNKKLKLNNTNSKQKDDKSPKKKKVERNAEEAKTNVFPMNRIRTMIKGEDPDSRLSQEALLAINNATEKFLEQFAQDAYACCVQDRKKSLIYQHLAQVVSKQRRYDFLSDFVPEKVKAEDALRERSAAGKGGC